MTSFFFFQAEDGIRDPLVTGVQTCALPIYGEIELIGRAIAHLVDANDRLIGRANADQLGLVSRVEFLAERRKDRSEERRVGKECRLRGVAYNEKKRVGELCYAQESVT